MEDHDAHMCRIFASLKNDKDSTFLVQLPEGFGQVFPSLCALQLGVIFLHPVRGFEGPPARGGVAGAWEDGI